MTTPNDKSYVSEALRLIAAGRTAERLERISDIKSAQIAELLRENEQLRLTNRIAGEELRDKSSRVPIAVKLIAVWAMMAAGGLFFCLAFGLGLVTP